MYGVISSEKFYEDIEKGVGETPIIKKIGEFTLEQLKQSFLELNSLNLSFVIVDFHAASEDDLYQSIKMYRIQRPTTRILIFAPGIEQGNKTLSQMVQMGIYDIVAPPIPEMEEDQEQLYVDFSPYIREVLQQPKTYADATRWEIKQELEQEGVKKVVKKEVVYEEKYINISSKTIGFVSLSLKAGASFIALNFAKAIADKNLEVSFIENPTYYPGKAFISEQLGFVVDEKEKGELNKYSIPHILKSTGSFTNQHIFKKYNIDFQITDPRLENIREWEQVDYLKMLNQSKNQYTIIDFGYPGLGIKHISNLLSFIDHLFVIVDPMPHEIDSNIDIFLELIENEKANFIINRWNDGIGKKHFKPYPFYEEMFVFPLLNNEDIYKMFYDCKIPYSNKNLQPIFNEYLNPIFKRIDSNILLVKNKKRGIFPKML